MPTVQRRTRAVWSTVLTVLALALVLVALTTPPRLEDMTPTAFLRLPVEALVLLAVVLVVPERRARLRGLVVVTAGALLAVLAVFRLLDVGFMQALNRQFDPMIDWRYAGSLVETVRGSAPGALGVLLLLGAGAALLAALLLVPLAVARLSARRPAPPRRLDPRGRGARCPVWLVLSLLGVRAGTLPVASEAAASYAYGQVARVPVAAARPARVRPGRGGRPGARRPGRRPPHRPARQGRPAGLRRELRPGRARRPGALAPASSTCSTPAPATCGSAGFEARSGYLTSPTFGAISWLAHATLQSGLWVDSQQRYDHLVTTRRETLTSLFGRAGWRTVAAVPANNRDWPQGAFYGFDHVYDSRNIGYRGPALRLPDDAGPVHPRRRPAARARARRAAAGDGGDRPGQQPRPLVAHAPPGRAGRRRRRVGLRRHARDPPLGVRDLARPAAGARGVRGLDRVLAAVGRVVPLHVRRRRPRGGDARRPPARDHRVGRGPRPRRARHGDLRATRRWWTGSRRGAGTRGCAPPTTRPCGGWTRSATSSSRHSVRAATLGPRGRARGEPFTHEWRQSPGGRRVACRRTRSR